MYNRLIRGGCSRFGDRFLNDLNEIMGTHRNADYRPVKTCHIRPSTDLHQLALRTLRRAPAELELRGLSGRVFSKLLVSSAFTESNLLSFLMFTPTYIRELIDLGYQDAHASRHALLQLFTPDDDV